MSTRSCAICALPNAATNRWFLLTEDSWRNAVSVYAWREDIADVCGVQSVCGSAHAVELVIHWMTTGSLDYPFARDSRRQTNPSLTDVRRRSQPLSIARSGLQPLGEIAIDRDAIGRVLSENPQAVTPLLQTLVRALDGDKIEATPRIGAGRAYSHSRRPLHSTRLA